MNTKPIILTSCLFLALPGVSFSQEVSQEIKNDSKCRCCEVGRFYAPWLKDLAKPKMREFLGNAELKITTKSEKAQAYFNQGLNCLHGFWEVEAYRYFLAAVEEDPDCAMAYWGICMSLPGKINEAQEERDAAFKQAVELSKDVSEHEKLYISMLSSLLTSGSKTACVSLAEIIEKFPTDLNAVGLYAYWNQRGYTTKGEPKEKTKESIKLLESGLEKSPDHVGLIHYYVHVLEQGPEFLKALPHVKKLTSKGKDISHLLHMPGHIYFLAGDYTSASTAFKQCYDSERNYFTTEKLTPSDLPNYSHNLHFWAKNEAERGNYTEALRIAQVLKTSLTESKRENITNSQNDYILATLEAYVHMRFREYSKASKLLDFTLYGEETSLRYYVKFLRHYCDLKAEMNGAGDWNRVFELSEEMEVTMEKFQKSRGKIKTAAREDVRAATIMNIYNEAAKVWMFNVDKKEKMDLSLADILLEKEAEMFYTEPPMLVSPMAEELGWLCLKFGENEKAISYFEKALKKRPKSGHIYSGMLKAYEKLGKPAKIAEYQKLLETAWK